MATATYGASLTCGGVAIQQTINRSGDHPQAYEVALPVGKAGTLSTRTNDTDGELTVTTGHGIITGDIIDIYWSDGMCYKATAGTVAGAPADTAIPFTGGTGDVLPTQGVAIVVTEQVIINTQIDGDAIQIAGVCLETSETAGKGHIDCQDSAHASIEEIDLVANVPKIWDVAGGIANVFTGNPITHSHASNGSATVAATLKFLSLEDSTP